MEGKLKQTGITLSKIALSKTIFLKSIKTIKKVVDHLVENSYGVSTYGPKTFGVTLEVL
jgi:hypothetical protein